MREKYYVLGYMDYTPVGYRYGFWGITTRGYYARIYEPGYYETGTDYL